MIDDVVVMQDLTDNERLLLQTELNGVRKAPSTGILLALFLGGLGAHRFYLGQVGLGLVYLFLCWTFVPALIALIECFLMTGRVQRYNQRQALDIAKRLRAMRRPEVAPA